MPDGLPRSFTESPPQKVTAEWNRAEPRDKPVRYQTPDGKTTAVLLPTVIAGIAVPNIFAKEDPNDYKAPRISPGYRHTRQWPWNNFPRFDREALTPLRDHGLGLLADHVPEVDKRDPASLIQYVTFNYNRETKLHFDVDAFYGIIFAFGSRPGYLALLDAGTVFRLDHGQALILNLESYHGSWVGSDLDEEEDDWHLNVVFWSRPQK